MAFLDIDRDTIIYLAGFADGEGTVNIYKQIRQSRSSPTYRCELTVGNTNEESVNLYQKTFGGKTSGRQRSIPNSKFYYQWWVYSGGMVKALEAMLPYLRIKREAAKLVIALQKLIWEQGARGGRAKRLSPSQVEQREKLYQRFKSLKNSSGYHDGKNQEDYNHQAAPAL